MAERTGLEPATPGVTGRYSNQLNYRSALVRLLSLSFILLFKSKTNKSLAMSYSHMGKPHTTIGATLFHF